MSTTILSAQAEVGQEAAYVTFLYQTDSALDAVRHNTPWGWVDVTSGNGAQIRGTITYEAA